MNRPVHLLSLTILLIAAQTRAETAVPPSPERGAPAAAAAAPATPAAKPDELEQKLEAVKREIKTLQDQLEKASSSVPTTADVQGVQADLENFKYQYQRDRETKSALSNRNLTITGLIQARGAYYDGNISSPVPATVVSSSVNNPTLLDHRSTTFDIPAAILAFNGLLYRDYEQARNLGFNLSAAATPTSGANTSFLSILDANVAYQVLPTVENDGDRLSITLGQQLLPFGNEANTTEELKPVINNAQFVGKTLLGQRQIGLIARGEFFSQYDFGYNYRQAALAVALGVVNGNGPNRDADHAFKDVVGRVAFTVPAEYNSWLRELRVGASAYLGWNTLNDGATTPKIVGTGVRDRYGVDVYYNHYPFGLTYEFVRGIDDVYDTTSKSIARTNANGHTATAFYSFGEQFLRSIKTQAKFDDWWPKTYQPFVRYDRWENDVRTPRTANDVYTAGLNVFFAETTKAQLNVNRRFQHAATGPGSGSTEVLAQLQFGF